MNTTEIETLIGVVLSRYATSTDNDRFGHVDGWGVQFKGLGGTIMGTCNLTKHIITIDMDHDMHRDGDQLKDTVLHECAHALAGIEVSTTGRRMAHGRRWKRWASLLGASPTATQRPKDHAAAYAKMAATSKYQIVYLSEDGAVKPMSICNRRLKNIERRGFKSIPASRGRLWYIRTEDFIRYKGNNEALKTLCFR